MPNATIAPTAIRPRMPTRQHSHNTVVSFSSEVVEFGCMEHWGRWGNAAHTYLASCATGRTGKQFVNSWINIRDLNAAAADSHTRPLHVTPLHRGQMVWNCGAQ